MEQRFEAQQKSLEDAIRAQRDAIDASIIASGQATTKAEAAMEIRFQSVNEFRNTLADQAAHFITRSEVESAVNRNVERIQEVSSRLHATATKQEIIASFEGLNNRVTELGERVTRGEGRGSGLNAGWGYLMPMLLVIATLIAGYLATKGH
jgi:ATP:corrinoid adenosyltransferase